MTGEELERAIVFIVGQQAQVTAGMESLTETVRTLTGTVETISGTVESLSRKVDRNADSAIALLAIAEIHEREITVLRQTQAEAPSRTDERLNALINIIERHINEGHSGKA
jgi:ABC-type transporter Mla subunit MlaD